MALNFELVGAMVLSGVLGVILWINWLVKEKLAYWDKKNINGPPPRFLFGTWKEFAFQFLGSADIKNGKMFGKIYGTFDGMTPNLMVTDPDLIKIILETSAENFQDLRYSMESSGVLKDSLLSLCGKEKSDVQLLINSLHNSHKLEKLIPKFNSSVEIFKSSLMKDCQENEHIDFTKSVTEYINDVLARSIFGHELESDIQFKEEFISNCDKVLNVKEPQSRKTLFAYLYKSFPNSHRHWLYSEDSLQYFVSLIIKGIAESTGKSLAEQNESNLIEIMVETAKEEEKLIGNESELVLKDHVIISKCISAILTLSNASKIIILLGLHELAGNKYVQEKLYEEITKTKSQKKLSYEDIQNLNYLDEVVKEVLRLYPYEFRVEKVATSDVKIGEVELNAGVRVSIPLYALHRSEELFPEPDTFDPERFSQANAEQRKSFMYLPFGQAGINGSDFVIQLGILAAKFTLVQLVETFKFSKPQQTGLQSLFHKGLTRVPRPRKIEIAATTRLTQ